ncbi:MAG: hypothetical protein OSA84_09595 [Akkermansiaceae bacterium]|nr:hypothetical protein [Akkermansiaceae bacterium]
MRASLYGHAYTPRHGPVMLYAAAGDWFAFLMIAVVIFVVLGAVRQGMKEPARK